MKFKVFTGSKPTEVEKAVNEWLASERVIVKTSGCSMMQIPGPFVNVGTTMVSVFYEDAPSA
jgi:hypothetical protein